MQKISIQIPQSCHERWDEMQPADQGRFCASCRKTVVDYTNYSDQELVRLLRRSSGVACGRFLDGQLNRPLVEPKSVISVWQQWISLLTMGLLGWQTARGQSVSMAKSAQPPPSRIVFSVSAIPLQKTIDPDANVTVSGRVMLEDSSGHLSPMMAWNVSVFQLGKVWQTQTDSSGSFHVAVPVPVQEGPVQIPVEIGINASFPGYLRAGTTVSVKPTAGSVVSEAIILRQLMPVKNSTSGGICLVRTPSRWQKLKRKLFR